MKPPPTLLEKKEADLLDAQGWVGDIKDDPLFSDRDRAMARNYVKIIKRDIRFIKAGRWPVPIHYD